MSSPVREKKANLINGITFSPENKLTFNSQNSYDFDCWSAKEGSACDPCEIHKYSHHVHDTVQCEQNETNRTSFSGSSFVTCDTSVAWEVTKIQKYSNGLSETIMQDVYCNFQQLRAGCQAEVVYVSQASVSASVGICVSSQQPEYGVTSLDGELELEDISLCDTFLQALFTDGSTRTTLPNGLEKSTTKLKRNSRKEKKRKKLLRKLPRVEPPNSFAEMGFWTTPRKQTDANDSFGCPVCFEVFFNPYSCVPCKHSYCEPCLRRIAKYNEDRKRPHRCPICRIIISRCTFNQSIHEKVLSNVPEEYQRRRKVEANNRYMSHPLPFTPKIPNIIAITNAISERQRNHEMREQAESYWKMVLTTAIFFICKGLVILGLVWVFSLFSEDGFITTTWDYFWDHLYQYRTLDMHKKAQITNNVFILILGFLLCGSLCCGNARNGYNHHNRR